MNLIYEWPKKDEKGLEQGKKERKHRYYNEHELNIVCKSNAAITIWFIWTRSARMGETSMNEIKSIKHYSKLISIEHSWMNSVVRHILVLEYLNTIYVQYSEILSNVTKQGLQILYPQ